MPKASELRALVDQAAVPVSGFNVLPLPGNPGYRVGRGLEGSVVLLTPPESTPEAPTNLKRLSLSPRVRCRIESESQVEECDAGVVEFRADDPALIDHFLGVSGVLVDLLGTSPAPGEVSRGMQRLLRLFASPDQARGSELGIWGELLAIASSHEPAALVDSWHAAVDDRFDFSGPHSRLEVKTTTRSERIHDFGLAQLLPAPGVHHQHVLSVMTSETGLGSSVRDLLDIISGRLSSEPSRQLKVLSQVGETLGADWPSNSNRRFDRDSAVSSMRLLRAADIPRVEPGPSEVLEVRLIVNVGSVSALSADELPAAGPLASRIRID